MAVLVEEKKRKTPSEIAKEVIGLIGVMIKTGAAQPGREAISLLETLAKGEYDARGQRAKKKAKKQSG